MARPVRSSAKRVFNGMPSCRALSCGAAREQAEGDFGEKHRSENGRGDLACREDEHAELVRQQLGVSGDETVERHGIEGRKEAAKQEKVTAGGEEDGGSHELVETAEHARAGTRHRVVDLGHREAGKQVDHASGRLNRGEDQKGEEAEREAHENLPHHRGD